MGRERSYLVTDKAGEDKDMKKPVLVVMAAGMGSRYGGLKQVTPVGPQGQALLDYALYDAWRAGFEEALFIISPAMEQGFPAEMEKRVGTRIMVRCVTQALSDVPEGYAVAEGRTKPWGTGHAVRAGRDLLKGPFAVINADDYYGPTSFRAIHDFLIHTGETALPHYAMVGYELAKTLSESGHVARGICKIDEKSMLAEIHERTHIIHTQEGAMYTEDGEIYRRLPENATASVNLWGFTQDFLPALNEGFEAFLQGPAKERPLQAEFYLPEVVGALLRSQRATVRVLPSAERWYGMTYAEDTPVVAEAIRRMTAEGLYPERLWA